MDSLATDPYKTHDVASRRSRRADSSATSPRLPHETGSAKSKADTLDFRIPSLANGRFGPASQVSRGYTAIDKKVDAFFDRPIERDRPYLGIDATTSRGCAYERIVVIVIGAAVNTERTPEVLSGDLRFARRSAPVSPSYSKRPGNAGEP